MSNQEKAKEIAKQNGREYIGFYDTWYSDEECEKSALEMAKWKDVQFDSMIIRFFHLIKDGIPFERAYKQITGRDWHKIDDVKAKPAWVKFIEGFEEGSDEWRIAHKLLQKYKQMGHDICGSIPDGLKKELKDIYNI